MPGSLVALGSNLGDRRMSLARAVELLRADPRIRSLACSRFHETAPIGGAPGQGPFLNAAVCFETSHPPLALHAALRHIEGSLGRERGERWVARAIDLDLLLYGDLVLDTEALTVPHPRMALRRFVLAPAVEVAPDMVHPVIGWTVARLLEHLKTALSYVALLGPAGGGKTALAASLAQAVCGRFLADPAIGHDEPHPPDRPSHIYRRQIEFLDRRAELLDCRHWPGGEEPTISDFYWDQCLAYARLELDDRGFETFCHAVERARPNVISPKLLVVLDIPQDDLCGWATAAEIAREPHEWVRLRSELLRLAALPDRGPVLVVNAADHRAQVDEVAAAIEAMK
ncbi:MAG TPA: 2-amino-4-hydroxy-6-hydroxymethyldihydropteridine diphosphokinase [Pirellulales bacterium]|jgi:2-amino-4-hydroxy-6-hydroxymethyldihydropteridine diphosphokinase|nr:2-amino-4-hydroxy-6-hydroxymethyldihydropteridine diphosphokinase [Pirellulales bacterium]